MTLPEDKKDFIKKEIKAVAEKLEVVDRYDTKVKGLENFVTSLSNFDQSLKDIDVWMKEAENQLGDIKKNFMTRLILLLPTSTSKENFCHKEMKYPKMLRTTKPNFKELSLTLMISTKGVVRLVTNLLKMSNIGLNTELVSGNIPHGLQVLKKKLQKLLSNQPLLMKLLQCMLNARTMMIIA